MQGGDKRRQQHRQHINWQLGILDGERGICWVLHIRAHVRGDVSSTASRIVLRRVARGKLDLDPGLLIAARAANEHDALRSGVSLQTSSCPNRGLIRCPRERGSSSSTEVRQRVKASITVCGQAAGGAAVTSAAQPFPTKLLRVQPGGCGRGVSFWSERRDSPVGT